MVTLRGEGNSSDLMMAKGSTGVGGQLKERGGFLTLGAYWTVGASLRKASKVS